MEIVPIPDAALGVEVRGIDAAKGVGESDFARIRKAWAENGLLLIRGQKWIAINQGKEYVRIQGIIRPIDIQPDNTILSTKVADASISYGAKGALADANAQSWLSRFFNSPWMPF